MEINIYHYVYAFLVLVLILGIAFLFSSFLRKYGIGGFIPGGSLNSRLKVLELKHLDNNNKIILFKKDNTEYLVLVGINTSLLLSSEEALKKDEKILNPTQKKDKK